MKRALWKRSESIKEWPHSGCGHCPSRCLPVPSRSRELCLEEFRAGLLEAECGGECSCFFGHPKDADCCCHEIAEEFFVHHVLNFCEDRKDVFILTPSHVLESEGNGLVVRWIERKFNLVKVSVGAVALKKKVHARCHDV